jgi:formylglycine-generating enzyme required for sulfatase activity
MIRFLVCPLFFALAAWNVPAQAGARSTAVIPLVAIRAAGDTFTMGDGRLGPNVAQEISYDFSISKFPVTNGQYEEFVEDGGYSDRNYWTSNGWKWKGRILRPAFWKDAKFNGEDQPVVGVSWYEAVAYCNWLSVKNGLAPAYDDSGRAALDSPGYRLPTEVEWEYAAAKGAPDQEERIYPWGDEWDPGDAVCRVAPNKASRTEPVGSRSPQGDTPQGLADMAGNVWQWCSDNAQSDGRIARLPHSDRYYFNSDSRYQRMVLRGGSWWNDFNSGFRASFRNYTAVPGDRHNVTGFRVVKR